MSTPRGETGAPRNAERMTNPDVALVVKKTASKKKGQGASKPMEYIISLPEEKNTPGVVPASVEEAGYKSFLQAIKVKEEKKSDEIFKKLRFRPELLHASYLAEMRRAMNIEDGITRTETFTLITWIYHVGLKIAEHWGDVWKRAHFPADNLRKFAEIEKDKKGSGLETRESRYAGVVGSYTGNTVEAMVDGILESLESSWSFNSKMSPQGREVVKQAYEMVRNRDFRGLFKEDLTDPGRSFDDYPEKVRDIFRKRYPNLYNRAKREGFGLYLGPNELD